MPQGTDPAGSRRDHSKHDMTNNAPTGNGTNVRWIEDTLGELLDEEGGNSVDEQAFENAKRAAREFGAAVNKLENPRNRTPQKIADLCGTAFEHGALFGAVVVNHEMRKELLRHREYPGDQECAKRLATFHSRHMETLAEEFENQLKVDRVGKLVRGTLVKAKKAIRLTRMWE